MVIKLSFNARRRWRSVARWATCAAVAFALAAVAALALGSIGAGSYAMAIIGAMIGGAAGAVAILWDVADAIEDII